MVDFLHSTGNATLTGTYDFRTATLALPSGTSEPAGIGGRIFFIGPSGTLVLHDGNAWKYLYPSGGSSLPAVLNDLIIWMDMGAGTASGTSPQSVVVNPSGATTGSFDATPPTYAMVSGNNSWVFADNSASEIGAFDVFDFNNNDPWVKTVGVIMQAGAIGATTRSIGGWKINPTANPTLDIQTQVGALGIRYGSTSFPATYTLDDKDGSCLALFAVISGSKAGTSSYASGCLYVGSSTFEQNFGSLQNTVPAVASGGMGEMGTVNACAMSIVSWMVWDRAITAAERADIVDYYAGRGINVL